jgi:acetyltransferase-like isoleucine patch superfamily enzyme
VQIPIDQKLKAALVRAGVEVLWGPGQATIAQDCEFETPCSLKWMRVEHSLSLGAFSYAVSGYFFAVTMGRYCSIGESVQFGRSDHPMSWLSTSPFQYLQQPLFAVGHGFPAAGEYHKYRPAPPPPEAPPTRVKRVVLGNDVWIGHGALVRPGVTVGDGAVIGAHAVVTKDVPPYAVAVGNPARIVKQRFPDDVVRELLELKWWRLAPWQMRDTPFHDIRRAIEHLRTLQELPAYEARKVKLRALVHHLKQQEAAAPAKEAQAKGAQP